MTLSAEAARVACRREAKRRYRAAHPERIKEQRRRYREQNLEKEKARIRRYDLYSKFGITPEQYDEMHAKQRGLCAICLRPESAKRGGRVLRLAVDHEHSTGQVRGLLCAMCNKAIGYMKDDPERLRTAACYVEGAHGC